MKNLYYNFIKKAAVLCLLLSSSLLISAATLFDNGPVANSTGSGVGGADESILQSVSLGLNTLGFGHQFAFDNLVADDFTIPAGEQWNITNINFYAYQTGSPTTSTITGVRFQIWDGMPGAAGSNVIFGDLTTNRLSGTTWSNVYRVSETTMGAASNRPIMRNTADAVLTLDAGTYWITWQSDGSLGSGPWAPPITITGTANTGNGLQSLDGGATYTPANDSGTGTPQQGFPFVIEGNKASTLAGDPIPTMSQWGLLIFGLLVLNLGIFFIYRQEMA